MKIFHSQIECLVYSDLEMILSLRELIVWTGLGRFEASLHSFALAVFMILTMLRVEGVFSSSWHVVFIPLYVALGLTVYYDLILYIRMVAFVWKSDIKKSFLLLMLLTTLAGIGLLLFAEYSIADFLDRREDSSTMVLALTFLLAYLFGRMVFVYRTVKRLPYF